MDENVPRIIKNSLQNENYEVLTLDQLDMRGVSNGDVAEYSLQIGAIIITFDSDFLKLKKELEKKIKAIYIKLHPRDPKIASQILIKHLNSCLTILKEPGVIILTEEGISIKNK
ncbi:MAG: DUF5615 family PIN-like protein [Candidatus Helarchaeota archaeon]|nr:DUF5615 family PIN-like protein [Candidatus Helarchaeota archaeon]